MDMWWKNPNRKTQLKHYLKHFDDNTQAAFVGNQQVCTVCGIISKVICIAGSIIGGDPNERGIGYIVKNA